MAKVQGQVFRIYEKEFRGKKSISVKLEDNPIFYRFGDRRHAGILEPGNVVEFEAGDTNEDGKSAHANGTPVQVKGQKSGGASAPSGGGGGGGAREVSIHYQSARKDALEFLQLAHVVGALKLPATEAKRLGVLEAALDKYTAIFFEDTGILGAVTRANEEPAEADEDSPVPKVKVKKAAEVTEEDDE